MLSFALVPLFLPISWYNVGLFYCPLLSFALARRSNANRVELVLFAVLYCLTTNDIVGTSYNDRLEIWSVPFWGAMALVVCFAVGTWREYYPSFFRGGASHEGSIRSHSLDQGPPHGGEGLAAWQ